MIILNKKTKNKSDLTRGLSDAANITQTDAKMVLDYLFPLMLDILENDYEIVISNFGRFYKSHKREKRGVHPVTQEPTFIPAYDTLLFKASDKVKERFNKKDEE